jgi:tetratricopeptide (TPR) repeat protein
MALADLYREANQTESAVDAYLQGYELLARPLRGDEAVILGDLFFQLDNFPRAENFYQIALESGDLSELPALFGLLKINVTNANWTVAERVVNLLDEEYPGALDTSELYTVREDLADWKEAKRRFEEEKKAQELASRENLENRLNQDLSTGGTPPTRPEDPTPPPSEEDTPPPEDDESETADDSDRILRVVEGEPEPETIGGGKMTVINDEDEEESGTIVLGFFPDEQPGADPIAPTGLAADIARARQFREEGVYSEAVRLLWNVLGTDPTFAEAWFELSKAYFANNEAAAAETASLEAMRLAPFNANYVLHHIEVIRRSRGNAVVIRELRLAQERFPNNPEILFELARGYDELATDARNAAYLYNRFLDDFPNHPLAPEVRTKLRRLGY